MSRQVQSVIAVCSGRRDLEFLIERAVDVLPNRPGPGRPRSPRVNGPRLIDLRKQAGMTQVALVDAVKEQAGHAGAFSLKSLQRYEQAASADPANLEAIAAVLTERLHRNVGVDEITFESPRDSVSL
jgi:hypothetical protein